MSSPTTFFVYGWLQVVYDDDADDDDLRAKMYPLTRYFPKF